MKNRHPIDGTYQVNGKDDNEFEIENDGLTENEKNKNRIVVLLNHPWRLIKEGGKLGVNGVKRFFAVTFLFSFANTILLIYSISRLLSVGLEIEKVLFDFLVFLIGIGFTIYSGYRTYQYVIVDTLRVIYENLSSLFKKISDLIIDKAEKLFFGKVELSNSQFAKSLDFGRMINSNYQKVPNILRIGIIYVLNKIPFVGMIIDLKEDIKKGNKAEASTKLYNKMDNFISESIFADNNTKWVWWLLPLNIVFLLILIKLKIG